jgi:hypothetical protein
VGRWGESLKIAQQFLNNRAFIQEEISNITEYFINAAASGYIDESIRSSVRPWRFSIIWGMVFSKQLIRKF